MLLSTGGKYYFTRDGSTIVAFVVGSLFQPGNGFKLIGAHTDSPNLKLKPVSKRSGSKLIQLNVECYGGGLWHTWFDRDLSVAGRVILRSPTTSLTDEGDASFTTELVKINRPILRIPNLCIHLRTPDERESFKVNKEDHLMPILCDEVEKALGASKAVNATEPTTDAVASDAWVESQQPELLSVLAEELQCNVSDIVDFELSLYDVQVC